jgi:hypothetical protein
MLLCSLSSGARSGHHDRLPLRKGFKKQLSAISRQLSVIPHPHSQIQLCAPQLELRAES